MLVPIVFKADGGDSSKKGKIRAEDLAALFAYSLSNKTGILNVLGKIDYYNKTVIQGEARFYLHSGYVVICGRLIYVEDATECVLDDLPASGSVTGSFGIRVDLHSVGNSECVFYHKPIQEGLIKDDLNENPTNGVYEFEIYRYSYSSIGGAASFTITQKTANLVNVRDGSYATAAMYAATDENTADQTATIKERLDGIDARLETLNFRSASTSSFAGSANGFEFNCVGNVVYGDITKDISWYAPNFGLNSVIFTMPEGYRPKAATPVYIGVRVGSNYSYAYTAEIRTNGDCVITGRFGTETVVGAGNARVYFTLGYLIKRGE